MKSKSQQSLIVTVPYRVHFTFFHDDQKQESELFPTHAGSGAGLFSERGSRRGENKPDRLQGLWFLPSCLLTLLVCIPFTCRSATIGHILTNARVPLSPPVSGELLSILLAPAGPQHTQSSRASELSLSNLLYSPAAWNGRYHGDRPQCRDPCVPLL